MSEEFEVRGAHETRMDEAAADTGGDTPSKSAPESP